MPDFDFGYTHVRSSKFLETAEDRCHRRARVLTGNATEALLVDRYAWMPATAIGRSESVGELQLAIGITQRADAEAEVGGLRRLVRRKPDQKYLKNMLSIAAHLSVG